MYWNVRPFLDNSSHFMYVKIFYNTEKQSPIKIKSSTENEYVNGIQKIPQQHFGAYDVTIEYRPHFGSFCR
jgi:hypothetical protein